MKKFFALLIAFFLGAVATFVVLNSLWMDRLGRKDQALFTLLRTFKENQIVVTREHVVDTVEKLYPAEDIKQDERSILIHKMEFIFIDGRLHEVKTY